MAWTLGPMMRNGFAIDDVPPLLRTEMDSGPARVTRTQQGYLTNVSGQVFLKRNPDELPVWRAFLHGEANLGQAWFDMPIITSGQQVTHLVRLLRWGPVSAYGIGWVLPLTVETREHLA